MIRALNRIRFESLACLARCWTVALFALTPSLLARSSPGDQSIGRARALAAANQVAQANEMLSTMISRDPHDFAAWEELGQVQLAQSLNDDALKSFEAVLKAKPGSTKARDGELQAAIASSLADRAADNGDRALATLMRAKRYVPDFVELLIAFGIQADSMQIYKEADTALSEAHRLPRRTQPCTRSHIYELDEQKMGDTDAHLRRYLRIKPDDATAHYGLGHLG